MNTAWRRGWLNVSALVGLALWWPAGFWGTGDWPHLPLHALEGDVVLLGAIAAAATVALLVRQPWTRLLIVVVLSIGSWLLDAPLHDTYPDERQVLIMLLVLGGALGLLLGSAGALGPNPAALALGAVAGLSPATWPHGAVLAVALALPFMVATWRMAAPTLLSVAGVLLVWLATSAMARALSYGWDTLRPQLPGGSKQAELRAVGNAAWDFLRTQGWDYCETLLRTTGPWLLVALVMAVLVVAGRGILGRGSVTSGVRRR